MQHPVGAGPAENRPHSGDQFAEPEGFCDVVVRSGLERLHLIVLRITHREHDYSRLGSESTNPLARLHPAYFGHVDVQQDDVNRPLANIVERFLCVPGEAHRIPAGFQTPEH